MQQHMKKDELTIFLIKERTYVNNLVSQVQENVPV